ncbi:MAG: phage tail protein I [Tepidiformaceae bacterium]
MADVTSAVDEIAARATGPGVTGSENDGTLAPAGSGAVRRTRQPRPASSDDGSSDGPGVAVEASVVAESPPPETPAPVTTASEVAADLSLTPSPSGPSGPDEPGGDLTDSRAHPSPYEWESPGVPYDGSTYMQYLPGIYSGNRFLARFLLIFEAILAPIDRTVENISSVFDPDVAPADVLPWLGSWLGLAFDEGWPEERRRELIRNAAMLYHWRGTKRGMSEFVRIYTGVTPEIVEPTLSQLSNSRDLAFRFTVRLTVPRGTPIDRSLLQRIIDAEKPAFAAGTLEVVEIAIETNGRVSHR